MQVFSDVRHDRHQIQIFVGDVDGEDSIALEMAEVFDEGLPCEEMDGYRIAGECVYGQQIKILRLLALQGKARIAQQHVQLAVAILQKSELRIRDFHNLRVYLIEAIHVSDAAIAGQHSGAQANGAHAHTGRTRLDKLHGQAKA